MTLSAKQRGARLLRILLVLVAKLCLTGGLLYWIWRNLPDKTNWQGLTLLHPALLLACIPTVLVQMALLAWRWLILARYIASDLPEQPRLRFWRFFQLTWVSLSIAQVLPAVIGDSFRIAGLRYDGFPLASSAKSVVLDRIIGLVGLVALIVPGVVFSDVAGGGRFWLLAAAAMLAGAMVVRLAWSRLPVKQAFSFVRTMSAGRDVELFVLAVVVHSLSVCAFQFLAEAFGLGIPLWVTLSVFPVALLMSILPISLGGWGVREASVVYGFSLYSVPEHNALLASLIFGSFQLCTAIPSVAVFLSWARQNHR